MKHFFTKVKQNKTPKMLFFNKINFKKVVFDTDFFFLPVLFVSGQIVPCSLGYSKSKLHISGYKMKLKLGEPKQSTSLVSIRYN